MVTPHSIEERVVLDCACLDVRTTAAARIREAVAAGLDWSRLAEVAERHRATPLVLRTLELISPEALQHPAASILRSRTRFIARRTLQLTREMLSLVKHLESHGIQTVPLKGPMLAMRAFGSLSSREFADLDLLVRRKDLQKGCALLEAQGYRRELQLSPRQEAAYIRSEHALTYRHEREQLTVELHWRLHDRYLSFPLSERDLWSNVEARENFGSQIRQLKPEYEFLFLCMHGAKHSWERLEWISCLHALALRHPPARWGVVISAAARLRSTRLLHLGLTLADALSSSEATQTPLQLLKPDSTVGDLAATVWDQMFTNEIKGSAREVYRFRFYLKAREHLWDRLQVVWNLTVRIPHPNSSAWERNTLPPSLSFVHYVLGPLSFFKKFGLGGLSGVLRSPRKLHSTVDSSTRGRL